MASASVATASSTTLPTDPTTPAFSDDLEWITAYLTIHSLSIPSRRYSFLIWIVVVLFFLAFAILHWTGSRGGFLGAHWTKWTLRRRTWRKKYNIAFALKNDHSHRQPNSLPSNAQLLCLALLLGGSLALAFVGPDYISPTLKVWQVRRDIPFVEPQRRNFIPNIAPYLPLQPQYTIDKAWWTSSARTGQIAFALLPLCVLFALKAPPFAIFAIPFMIQFFFDKLAWLHRWTGRLIWFLTSIHVAFWSVQLAQDHNPSTGRVAYVYAFSYMPFIFGWVAFALLTSIIVLSMNSIRRNFYEAFYFLHVLLVPLMLTSAAFHHPTLWWWCWGALAIWAGERLWRWTWWFAANTSILGSSSSSKRLHPAISTADTLETEYLRLQSLDLQSFRPPSSLNPHYQSDKHTVGPHSSLLPIRLPTGSLELDTARPTIHHPSPYIPPPGYAHAELLSGHTVRLRLITPGFLPWAPGQHFLIKIPSVSRFTTHPFTCASICDYESPTDEGRLIVMLIRTRNGWTQDLWDLVSRMTAEHSPGDTPICAAENLPSHGVLLRTYVDGPFGSSIRARWGNYSTVLIIAGGSGVSFGLSVLQYICMCLSGRDGKNLGGQPGGWGKKSFLTKRVRFVWLVREYSHIQWCASIVRRCLSLVPSSALQIDIFITNFKPIALKKSDIPPLQVPQRPLFTSEPVRSEDLQPPHPSFARDSPSSFRSDSNDSLDNSDSDVDLSYYTGESGDPMTPEEDIGLAHDSHILELTNFDGDDDTALPGEHNLSRKVKKEGKLRRAQSRKFSGEKTVRLLQPPSRPSNMQLAANGVSAISATSGLSTNRLLPSSINSDKRWSEMSMDTFASPTSMCGDSPTRGRQSTYHEPTFSLNGRSSQMGHAGPSTPRYSTSSWEGKSDAGSFRGLLPSSAPNGSLDPVQFDISEEEARDINVVAEHARPGKPKLDRILADEVEQSEGSVMVACCGPTSLNVMVRKIIAEQIDPGRVWRGDMRGSISLISEEFEY
ncbi:uncharacterized protein F5147DRAFT_92393 [Suillus discolor]|uniref:ferric-chelate reductase (NADPH) n=1 Tax=Suillus discolor TaxID=1912936 RepID=A0A9P7F9P5_9AGAM|nr:uncharacterized protein F5147DRAFT_92393 [Suillus discolor]KAG2111597.1 hypothetical protein F5147DRAFT_92393 [Suillus discolor]